MENVLRHLVTYQSIYLAGLLFILVILLFLIVLARKEKRVKPIELEEITKEEAKSDLEDVIAALESNQNERPMTTFEQEQEENAIISYQELVAAVQDKKSKMQEVVEPVQEVIEEPKQEVIEESPRKFKNSEVISPVFGKANQTNDDFLKELKDFRKNL